MAKNTAGQKEKVLSLARKKVLIKAVLQVIPSYVMSAYIFPKTLCDEITAIIRQFWWTHGVSSKEMFWLSGKRCVNERRRAVKVFVIWKYLISYFGKTGVEIDSKSFFLTMLKENYSPNTSLMEARIGSSVSYAWGSFAKGEVC